MWNSAQPLSLSAKIFLHHRQRLRFAFASQIRSITRTSSTNQFKHTWDQSKTTESTAERQLVDPSIFTLASDSGCFLVLSSCVICVPVCDKHTPKAHKAMETQKHYGPTNKISACAYESQCHFCIHLVRASRRAQTGIVWNCAISSVGGRTTETQSNSVTNKSQRISLSCWCLHSLSGNRTIQVHTVCFSVVAFMGCHQWCLSHQSSWNSTTHHCSFEQLKNKVKNTSTSRTSQVFPNFGRTCRDKGSINRTMWNSAQPLSLSAKIFLHHRQRLRFAFASQIRSITRKSSTEQAECQPVDPSIFTLASDSGCFLVLSSCVICVPVCDKHTPKAHKAMETRKHYGPTNKISAYPYESQCHSCIHSVRASQRAQTGIVWNCAISSVRGRTTETQSNSVINKSQRISLSCWCLHSLSGNRTIQVHTVCFSVVAFMGCHQWCLSHQSSWNSTTHHCSFEQLKNSSKTK